MRFAPLPILASALVFTSCAAHEASGPSAQVDGLRAEMDRLRARADALENRVESLENREALRQAGTAPIASPKSDAIPQTATAPESLPDVPALTVVKLTPSRKPPPPIDTKTPVVEPDPEVLDALADTASQTSAPGSAEVAQAEYQNGLEALRVGNLEGGVRALTGFAKSHPENALADNALYFAGIGDIGLQDYDQAADAFATVIARYPAGDAVAEAMLKLADCRVHLHQRDEARSLFARVISTYPGTAAATQAEQRLASLTP